MRITLESGQELLVPLSLFHERPLAPGQALDLDAYDQWLLLRQYRHALDRAVGYLAAVPAAATSWNPGCFAAVTVLPRWKWYCTSWSGRSSWMTRTLPGSGWRPAAAALWANAAFPRNCSAKGISRAQAEEALTAVDEDAEAEACRQAAEKLASRYSREASRQGMQKLTQALVRRGFGWEDARRAAEQALQADE